MVLSRAELSIVLKAVLKYLKIQLNNYLKILSIQRMSFITMCISLCITWPWCCCHSASAKPQQTSNTAHFFQDVFLCFFVTTFFTVAAYIGLYVACVQTAQFDHKLVFAFFLSHIFLSHIYFWPSVCCLLKWKPLWFPFWRKITFLIVTKPVNVSAVQHHTVQRNQPNYLNIQFAGHDTCCF